MNTKKTKPFIIILSLIICIASTLSSCSYMKGNNEASKESSAESESSTDARIKELEAQIISLLQTQQLSETERKKEISLLKAELESLKEKAKETEKETESEIEEPRVFDYTLDGYKATITKINTDGESIVIPSVIDGHAVVAISNYALSSTTVKRIVLSDGIESLDWFAFKGCSALSFISIPPSVTSIGYGAFDGTPKSFTIECEKDSFAMKYAQSYGIKYEAKAQ